MSESMDRRGFLRLGALGVGAALAWNCPALAGTTASSYRVEDSRKGGCAYCARVVNQMMSKSRYANEIYSRLPEGAEVVFYVRRHGRNTKVAEHAIGVGNCARAVKSKVDAFMPGCGAKRLTPATVHAEILRQLPQKKS